MRIMKFRVAAFLSSFVLGVFGLQAFDYQTKTVPVLPIESYPARMELAGVTIAADPYPSDEMSFSAFDVKDLNSRGYYPVHIIIQNSSQAFLNLRTRNVLLITSAGQQLYTTPATLLVQDVLGKVSTKAGSPLADFTAKELTNKVVDPGTVADGFIFFFTPNPHRDFFAGSTLYIPKLEEEGTHKPLGPFSIPLDSALANQPQKPSRTRR